MGQLVRPGGINNSYPHPQDFRILIDRQQIAPNCLDLKPALPATCCVILGKLVNISSKTQFPYFKWGTNISTYLLGLLLELSNLIYLNT